MSGLAALAAADEARIRGDAKCVGTYRTLGAATAVSIELVAGSIGVKPGPQAKSNLAGMIGRASTFNLLVPAALPGETIDAAHKTTGTTAATRRVVSPAKGDIYTLPGVEIGRPGDASVTLVATGHATPTGAGSWLVEVTA